MCSDTPPPCTLFYLANCKFGSECQYGHDYVLSEDDYENIRTNAKNNPCTAILKGKSSSFILRPFALDLVIEKG